ncbi:MAG: DNA polymerase III subunit delta' C-terminal domain-containing protein [Planctomycetota bacterium]|jgi:hypothetical protein
MGLEENRGRYFAALAQGSIGAACRWAELELADARLYETKNELLNCLAGCELADALNLAERFVTESKRIAGIWSAVEENTSKTDVGRKAAKTLIRIIILALHDAMMLNATATQKAADYDQREQIEKLAGRFDAEHAAEKIADCYRMLHWIESNVSEKLIFEQLLLSLPDSDTMPAWR